MSRTRDHNHASRVIRDAAGSREHFKQGRGTYYLVNHRMLHSSHHGNRLAVLFFNEDGNLWMRHQAVLDEKLLDLAFEFERGQTSCLDFARHEGIADVAAVAHTNVSR